MSNQQSTISQASKLLYNEAVISIEKNDDRQALSYYTQALHPIGSNDGNSLDIDRLQYNSFLNMCKI